MARPEIPINWKRAEELLIAGCTGVEVASHFGIHAETFYNKVKVHYGTTFTELQAKKKAHGDALIREAQFKKAVQRLDNRMLEWLGKQRLGQKEHGPDNIFGEDLIQSFNNLMDQIEKAQKEKKKEEEKNAKVVKISDNPEFQPAGDSAIPEPPAVRQSVFVA
jgi:hypothetical protein